MYLVLDCEMGGLGLDKSLLTLSLVECDDNFQLTGHSLVLNLIPNDGVYKVEPRALLINKIDLIDLSKYAHTYKEAGTILYNFLNALTDNGKDKAILVGKNMSGDLAHIFDKLMSKGTWDNFVSYQHLELSSAVRTCQLLGLMPPLEKTSLNDICNYFNIRVDNLHEAYGDCVLIAKCFREIKNFSSKLTLNDT